MKKSFIVLNFFMSYLFSFNAVGDDYSKTTYAWAASHKEKFKGNCFEIDKETMGQKFTSKVSKKLCRPLDTKYHWEQHPTLIKGRCILVDSKTGGLDFAQNAPRSKCYPDSTEYYFHFTSQTKGFCVKFGTIAGGKPFRVKVSDKNCIQDDVAYRFELDKSKLKGKCYKYDIKTKGEKYIKNVSTFYCKPSSLEYMYREDPLTKKGLCYEIDAIEGPSRYISKSKLENCFNQNVSKKYSWIQDQPKVKTGCYEMGVTLQENIYRRRVSTGKCRPLNTEKIFIKLTKTRGTCYEVDSDTFGKNFKDKISIKKCRPKSGAYHYQLLNNKCFIVDDKTRGEKYIESTQNRYCLDQEKITGHKWIPSQKSIWKGHCEKIINERGYVTNKKDCKPKKVKYTWHNEKPFKGHCYLVHLEYGPSHFVMKAKRDDCKPEKTSYYFFKNDNQIAGTCYLVDTETRGKKYHRIEKGELCLDNI